MWVVYCLVIQTKRRKYIKDKIFKEKMEIFIIVRKAWYLVALLYDIPFIVLSVNKALESDIEKVWLKRYIKIIVVWGVFFGLEILGFLSSLLVNFLKF